MILWAPTRRIVTAQRLSASTNQRRSGGFGRRFGSSAAAQRLSASTNQRPRASRVRVAWARAAQRLSASTNQRRVCRLLRCRPALLLNAFRHQRINDSWGASISSIIDSCSTPFGINESTTSALGSPTAAGFSAQRLSASTNQRHRTLRSRQPDHDLLNAFRHQRINDNEHGGLEHGAERLLNAFRHQRINDADALTASLREEICSTPFGINESTTMAERMASALSSTCSTPFGINESTTRDRRRAALEAFPAQRLSASTNQRRRETGPIAPPPVGCSTPFGINESTTGAGVQGCLAEFALLNAFRHQRINDVCGSFSFLMFPPAQRLSASTNQRRARAKKR